MKARSLVIGAGVLLAALWIFRNEIMTEFNWRASSEEGLLAVTDALAKGNTGPQKKPFPCMAREMQIDLEIALEGPFPAEMGRSVVMSVIISSDSLMVNQLYLGPPVRRLALPQLPICVAGTGLPMEGDGDSLGRIIVQFTDVENGRFMSFQGEEALPVLAWRRFSVDWRPIPWQDATGGFSTIMARPL
jgi:hypothetical protein